jgi:hypothetical protein
VNTGGTVEQARREMEAAQNKLSSVQINRMRESKRVHSDNVKLVERLEKVRRNDFTCSVLLLEAGSQSKRTL